MEGVAFGAAESPIHRELIDGGFPMAAPTSVALLDHFAALPDPRQHAKVLYPLMRARIVGRPRNHLNRAVGHRQSRQPPCSLLWEEQSGVSGELRFVRYRRRPALKPAPPGGVAPGTPSKGGAFAIPLSRG
jgi:hypothetical protein